jgi:hypothetical protein
MTIKTLTLRAYFRTFAPLIAILRILRPLSEAVVHSAARDALRNAMGTFR